MRSTSATLLGRLRDLSDAQAWKEFEARYQPRLIAWCLAKGLQQVDAEDVAQNVLLKVATRMETFEYDPKSNFSGWLRTVWHNAWYDFVKDRKPGGRGSGDSAVYEQLLNYQGGDLTEELASEFQRELLEEALTRARPKVSPRNWEIFQGFLNGKTPAELAEEHGLTLAALGMAKSRVLKTVKQEIAYLEGTDPEGGKDKP